MAIIINSGTKEDETPYLQIGLKPVLENISEQVYVFLRKFNHLDINNINLSISINVIQNQEEIRHNFNINESVKVK